MQKKKSRFWLFIWSLVPGAGHMYLGFMKMGISLMLGFMTLIAVAALTNLGVLAIFPIALYIYSFFHANNLGALSDAEFYSIQDQYLLGMEGLDSIEKIQVSISQKYRKVAAFILIAIGAVMLWNMGFDMLVDIFEWNGWNNYYLRQVSYFVSDQLPRVVIAIAVIWIGISLIRGKKVEYIEDEQDTAGKRDITNEQAGSDGQNAMNGQTASMQQNVSDSQENR